MEDEDGTSRMILSQDVAFLMRANGEPMVDVSRPSLDDLLERRRRQCEEFESQPAATTADANSSSVARQPESSTHHVRDLQLGDLLAERRQKCEVLESSPVTHSADALWNKDQRPAKSKLWLESEPKKQVADVKCEDPSEKPPAHPKKLNREPSGETPVPAKVVTTKCVPDEIGSLGSDFAEAH